MATKQEAQVRTQAQSLVEEAKRHNRLRDVLVEASSLIVIINDTHLDSVLSSDKVTMSEKIRLLAELDQTDSSELTNLMTALIHEESLDLFLPILKEVVFQIGQLTRVYDMEVATVVPLTVQQKENMRRLVEKRFSLGVNNIIEIIDPSLIGGFIITINHQVLDASIKGQLAGMRKAVK